MAPIEAARLLALSGMCAVIWSALLGVLMLVPLQPWAAGRISVNMRQLGAAHLDWIMLGLYQGLCAGVVVLFALAPSAWIVIALMIGAWLNPVSYVFRAFGVNAFAFAGGGPQKLAAALGAISSALILSASAALAAQAALAAAQPQLS